MKISITNDIKSGVYDSDELSVITRQATAADGDAELAIDMSVVAPAPPPAPAPAPTPAPSPAPGPSPAPAPDKPLAAFTATVDGASVACADGSVGGDKYQWIWGDGSAEYDAPGNATHVYPKAGTHTIQLTVMLAGNGVAWASHDVTTALDGTPQAPAPSPAPPGSGSTPAPPPEPLKAGLEMRVYNGNVAFPINHSTGAKSCVVNFNAGDSRFYADSTFRGVVCKPGTYTATLTATGADGSTDTATGYTFAASNHGSSVSQHSVYRMQAAATATGDVTSSMTFGGTAYGSMMLFAIK